jgi:hypothetical protein
MGDEKLRDKLKKLTRLLGSANPNEAAAARSRINEILAKNKKTWNDLCDLLEGKKSKGAPDWGDEDAPDECDEDRPPARPSDTAAGKPSPPPLDLICRLIEHYLHLTDAQRIALTLWIAHTFIYNRFSITPRLALLSPVRGCGKSTALRLAKFLGFNTHKTDNTTAAVLFRRIDRERTCVLLAKQKFAPCPDQQRPRMHR